jgi:outer membrane protein assembly factor BamD (BamD/ComL family)
VYYFIEVNGGIQSGTFTRDLEEAEKSFEAIKELVVLYPETVTETIKMEEV